MDHLLKLLRTYRLTPTLPERLRFAEEIFRIIEPDLRFFVFASAPAQVAEDVFQEVLKAVATGMGKFEGESTGEFWKWSYRIARNKLNDQFRRKASDRLQPMAPEELWEIVDASAADSALSAADRLDLEYAIKLLSASKPECYDLLWKHFVFELDYAEIAEEQNLKYDAVRMRIARCLDQAKSLLA